MQRNYIRWESFAIRNKYRFPHKPTLLLFVCLDLKEGIFYADDEPAGEVVATGKRPKPGFRGDVTGAGTSRSTAPLFWYTSYLNGGGMAKALQDGVTFGFKGGR